MPICPDPRFRFARPDEVAECYDGVLAVPGLYEALWQALEDAPPRSSLFDIEDNGPSDVIGLERSVADVWDRFSSDQQAALNQIANAQSW